MQNLGVEGSPVDYSVLDKACVDALTVGDRASNEAVVGFKQRSDAWTHIDKIIDSQLSPYTKFVGLQVLTDLVKSKWAMVAPEQRAAIKDFLVNHVLQWSFDSSMPEALLNQIDTALVAVILREWPQQWPSIVDDIISSTTTQPETCKNNLNIIAMLSSEIVDFGEDELTSTRVAQISAALDIVSPQIYQLIETVLSEAQDRVIIIRALSALKSIVKSLHPKFIFETQLVPALCNNFLQKHEYQSIVLSIFGEIAAREKIPNQYMPFVPQIFDYIVSALQQTITQASNITDLSLEAPEIIKSLTFTLSSFISKFGSTIEMAKQFDALNLSFHWITEIMKITDLDNFKTCCEMWYSIVQRYYIEKVNINNAQIFEFYQTFFPMIRRIMVKRMERPIDIIIVENEDGTVSKEETRNTAQIELYNTMKSTLVLLSNIDSNDTIAAIQEKVAELHQKFSTATLNSICWSSGAISGSLSPSDEKGFVINILKELLDLSSKVETIELKAIVSSNIMFVCSSYPRFLMEHYQFLTTIVGKLFEFMQNDFPGVKEEAVDAFTRIAEKCRRKFLVSDSKKPPLVDTLILQLDGITSALSNDLKARMYNAISLIIVGCNDDGLKAKLTLDLMKGLNEKWNYQINNLQEDDFQGLINILFVLRCNIYVAENVGQSYHVQLQAIFESLCMIYQKCCIKCSQIIQQGGTQMSQGDMFRINYQIKSSIIQILIKFVCKTNQASVIKLLILPPVVNQFILEFSESHPLCRIPELLTLFKEIIDKHGEEIVKTFMPSIIDQLFKHSVELISDDYESFIQFRIPLAYFQDSIAKKCFSSLFSLPWELITYFENAIEWGCQNPQADICIPNFKALNNLYSSVENKGTQQMKNQFYHTFFNSTINMVFTVMTDSSHKFAFLEQAKLVKKLFSIQIDENNPEAIAQLLYQKFQTRELEFFRLIVSGLLQRIHLENDFKGFLRDFLIEVKQYSTEDPDLFVEERNQELHRKQEMLQQIPGMNGPANPEETYPQTGYY